MVKLQSISDIKKMIIGMKPITPWEEIQENAIYHVPPLGTLERREIYIISKNGKSATYRKIGDKEQTERTLAKGSVYAQFLVKRKKY